MFCSKLETKELELTAEKVAEMIIVGSRYKHSKARELTLVARDKIRRRRQIIEDTGFRDRLSGENLGVLFEFLTVVLFADK